MSLVVQRPKGAPMDVAELEYCSALRQTDTSRGLRSNGSITADDVRLHILSRHGVRVSVETVEQEILLDLVGGREYMVEEKASTGVKDMLLSVRKSAKGSSGDEEEGEKPDVEKVRRVTPLDLVQQVTLLIIPELKKLSVMDVEDEEEDEEEDDDKEDEGDNKDHGKVSPGDEKGEASPPVDRRAMLMRSGDDQASRSGWGGPARDLFRPRELNLPMVEPTIIDAVLLILLETSKLSYGVELTVDVIQQMLLAFEEEYWPEEVIEQMLVQASGKIPEEGDATANQNESVRTPLKLNRKTFLTALTADLDLYDEQVEDLFSTHFMDANAAAIVTSQKIVASSSSSNRKEEEPAPTESPLLQRVFTGSSIDYTADTYASFSWAILVWFLLMMLFISFMMDFVSNSVVVLPCTTDVETLTYGCQVASAVVKWLEIMLKLSIIGGLFVTLATLGNSVYFSAYPKIVAASAISVSVVIVVVVAILSYVYDVQTPFFDTTKADDAESSTFYLINVIVGSLLLAMQLVQFIRLFLPSGKTLPRIFELAASAAAALERATKEAASFKVRRMMEHSLACHRFSADDDDIATGLMATKDVKNARRLVGLNIDGRLAHALFEFQQKLMEKETIGGVVWTLKSLFSTNTLTRQEGLWIYPRLVWCNLGQWVVIVIFIVLWVVYGLNEDVEMEGITSSGYKGVLSAGAIAGLLAALTTTVRYLPSAMSTVLCFRHGMYGSLRDPMFKPYRFAHDTSGLLFGSCIFGLVATTAFCWVVVSAIVFAFVYEFTRDIALVVLAQVIGIVTTLVIKLIVLVILRASWYGGFYRRQPGPANIMMVVMECWNMGLSVGYMTVRAAILTFLAIFYISRIDTPFLADGVGWLFNDIPLDAYPVNFRKDLLIHDAHRHPYMERWALMYLLKIRHGKKFGTPAGAAWRILFTLALMPWLRKHRVHPKGRQSWTTTHITQTGMSYEDIFDENKQLKSEVERLRELVQEFKLQDHTQASIEKDVDGRPTSVP